MNRARIVRVCDCSRDKRARRTKARSIPKGMVTCARMVSDEFVAALSERAAEAEELRRLPAATVADFRACGLAGLLLPARYGGQQADFPEILDAVRRMAHGCASSAWTLGFYMLHNWMLALYGEQ